MLGYFGAPWHPVFIGHLGISWYRGYHKPMGFNIVSILRYLKCSFFIWDDFKGSYFRQPPFRNQAKLDGLWDIPLAAWICIKKPKWVTVNSSFREKLQEFSCVKTRFRFSIKTSATERFTCHKAIEDEAICSSASSPDSQSPDFDAVPTNDTGRKCVCVFLWRGKKTSS